FKRNGFFHNPSNGDIGLETMAHNPGNCFSGDTVPDGTDPSGIETNPAYQPSGGMCTQANAGDQTVLAAQLECDGQFFGPCPSGTVANYPRPQTPFPTSTSPPALPPVPSSLHSMPDPCSGVPKNPWCH